jgi:hypothetical protein
MGCVLNQRLFVESEGYQPHDSLAQGVCLSSPVVTIAYSAA